METNNQFRLQEIMKERGLTLEAMGQLAGGLSASSVRNAANGVITLEKLQVYADALGIEVWELFYNCGASGDEPEQNQLGYVRTQCPNCGKNIRLVVSAMAE